MVKIVQWDQQDGLPSQEEIEEAHTDLIHQFIQRVEGLRSMVLVGVREVVGGHADAVEVMSGATQQDLIRASSTILEAVTQKWNDGGRGNLDAEQIEMLKTINKMLMELGGDDPDQVEVIGEMQDTPIGGGSGNGTKH